jgi:hypothetical protein
MKHMAAFDLTYGIYANPIRPPTAHSTILIVPLTHGQMVESNPLRFTASRQIQSDHPLSILH